MLTRVLHVRRRSSLVGLTLLLSGTLVAACGGGDYDDPADSPLALEVTPLSLTIQNTAGLPLTDVTIAIVPAGAQTEYTQFYSRIEGGERRDISFSEFNGADGTPFSLRVATPRSIKVMASDINGESYDIELPWED